MLFFNSIALSIHTERLHDDRLWEKIRRMVDFFYKNKIRAIWFSINPTALAYSRMNYDEKKWIERLRYLSEHEQIIQQHTHFYKIRKGDYDLSAAHVKKRLLEDRHWLEDRGYKIRGFVSGTWVINRDIMEALVGLNYQYDCSARTFDLAYLKNRGNQMVISGSRKFNSLWEIPTTTSIKKALFSFKNRQLIYLHDYDLNNFFVRTILKTLIFLNKRGRFVTPLDLI